MINSQRQKELKQQLKNINSQLKLLQNQFLDLQKRLQEEIKKARAKSDEKKVADLRKQMGLR